MPPAMSYALPGAMNRANRSGYDSTMKDLVDQYNYLYPTVTDEQERKQRAQPVGIAQLGAANPFYGEYEYRRDSNDEGQLADVVSKLTGKGGVDFRNGGSIGGGGSMAPPRQGGGGYDAVSEQQDRDQQNYWMGQARLRGANAGADIAESRALDSTFGQDERRQNLVSDAGLAGQAAVKNYETTAPIREGEEAAQERLFRERYGDPAQIRADAQVQGHEIDAAGRLAVKQTPNVTNSTQSRTVMDPGKNIDALMKYKASLAPADPGKTSFWGSWGGARPADPHDQPRIDRVNDQIDALVQQYAGGGGATTEQTQSQEQQPQGIAITRAEAQKIADKPENRWTEEELQRRMQIYGYYIDEP